MNTIPMSTLLQVYAALVAAEAELHPQNASKAWFPVNTAKHLLAAQMGAMKPVAVTGAAA